MGKKLDSLKAKDRILSYLISHSGYGDSVKISEELDIPHATIKVLCEQLGKLVSLKTYPNMQIKEQAYSITIKNAGRYFYEHDGYVKTRRKSYVNNLVWAVITAFIAAIFTIPANQVNCGKSDKKTKIQEQQRNENTQQVSQVPSRKIDSGVSSRDTTP